ncbi:MBL fold metallo-hydrolase [Rhizobium sp. 16-449-1b]|uniref:MBL fold metallo-hydrolase n=1 Tax=Rhizobium sp. 16-449-1b TaxID=2819989 RepID=UPI001ADABFB2|nr:MBL fold metallo-hydrolase [Rhizobium sp. 16-449-1b]MBO9198601.1 MBL fold metallo-hydrolase [Rhizobium sp. 16-449-1b]
MFSKLAASSSLGRIALGAFLAMASMGTPAFVPAAYAAAPMHAEQAPGYYRLKVGAFEVTALSDGTLDLPADKLLSSSSEDTRNALAASHLTVPVETSFNSYLINTGERLILIDTGGGALFGSRLGNLVANMKTAGYTPDQVDDVLLTHLHPDHVGGLVKDGALVFPKAIVHADRHDSEYWLSDENKAKLGDPDGFFAGAVASLRPYIEKDRFKAFDGDTQFFSGISATTAYGHTPGSIVYAIESEGKKLLVIGDLIHVGSVQFAKPEVTIAFDTDRAEAVETRRTVFEHAAQSGAILGGAHIAFPGLGTVRANGNGFDWIPVNYSTEF